MAWSFLEAGGRIWLFPNVNFRSKKICKRPVRLGWHQRLAQMQYRSEHITFVETQRKGFFERRRQPNFLGLFQCISGNLRSSGGKQKKIEILANTASKFTERLEFPPLLPRLRNSGRSNHKPKIFPTPPTTKTSQSGYNLMKTEFSPLGALFSQINRSADQCQAAWAGRKHQLEEGKMDWAKVLLTILGVASKIAIDAMNSVTPKKWGSGRAGYLKTDSGPPHAWSFSPR